MEIVLKLQRFHELVGVLVEEEAHHKLGRLQCGPFLASFECLGVREVSQGSARDACLLNVLVNVHAFESQVKVEWLKHWLGGAKILRVVHAVILLLLVSVQVRGSPPDFEAHRLALLVLSVLQNFLGDVDPLHVDFEVRQRLAIVEYLPEVREFLVDLVRTGRVLHERDGAIANALLEGLFDHVLLIGLAPHGVEERGADGVALIHALHGLFIIQHLARGKPLLVVDVPVSGAHVLHDCNFGRHLSFGGPPLGEEGLDGGRVLVDVPVLQVLDAVDVHVRRVVEVVHKREASALDHLKIIAAN